MSKFLKLLHSVLNEEDLNNTEEPSIEPSEMDSKIPSALPEPKDVVLDVIKYKTLLKALKDALYKSSSDNLEDQRELSNINLDTDDLSSLKKVEDTLMVILNQNISIPRSE